jgi:hypothetical protein
MRSKRPRAVRQIGAHGRRPNRAPAWGLLENGTLTAPSLLRPADPAAGCHSLAVARVPAPGERTGDAHSHSGARGLWLPVGRPSRAYASNFRVLCVKMVCVNKNRLASGPLDGIDEDARVAAITRLHDLFSRGGLSIERFSGVLDQVFAAPSHAELEAAMSALPPSVRLTPASRRLARPLVLRAPGSELRLGPGWQLAADTTIGTGSGAALIDLSSASWDAHQINLRLETWGSIEVLVPEGVAVQLLGGSATVQLESLSPPVPGGPLLRISTSGPTGVIRIRHPKERNGGPFTRWRRRRRQAGLR